MDTIKTNNALVLRKIGSVFFIIDVTRNKLYELNQTAADVFSMLSQSYSIEKIVEEICERYEMQRAVVQPDIDEVVNAFVEIGAVITSTKKGPGKLISVVPKRPFSYYVNNYWSKQEHPYKVKSFELTPRCNFLCYHCYQGELKESGKELDTGTIKRIIDKMVDIGALQVVFSGGDPFIRPDFSEIYRYAKYKGMLIRVFTNGSMITESHLSLFKELPPERLIVSVYGFCEETYQKTTKRFGMYEKVMNNINEIIKAKVPLSLKLIVSKLTIEDFPAICQFAKDNRVELRYAFYIYPSNTNDTSICDYMIDVKDMLKIDISYQKEFNQKVTQKKNEWMSFYKKNGYVPQYLCDFPHNQFYVDYEGTIFGCSAGLKQLGGNILTEKFETIWQRFKSIRNTPMKSINECIECKALYFCVNCPADEYSFYGNVEMINEKICLFAKAKYLYYYSKMSYDDIVKLLKL